MRFRLTFLLLALNGALLAALLYMDRAPSTDSLRDAARRLVLPPDFVIGLDRIVIRSQETTDTWILEKSGDSWNVQSPVTWKANPFAVEQLLFQLLRLSWESRFSVDALSASGQSLASYRLEEPAIEMDLHNGETHLTLSLGAPTEIGNRLYILASSSEDIHVVSRELLDVIEKDPEAFLEKRLFDIPREQVRSFQVQDRTTSTVRVRLERTGEQWRFVSPMEALANDQRVSAFLENWYLLEADSFLAPSEAESIDGREALRLSFQGIGQQQTLLLMPEAGRFAETPFFLAQRETWPAVFRIPAEQVRPLRSLQEDLRENRVLAPVTQSWNSLEVQFGDLGLTLQQLESGQWQVLYTLPEGDLRTLPADPGIIGHLKNLLAEMEAVRFVSDAPSNADLERFGLTDPQRRVTLRLDNGDNVEFRIGGLAPDEQTLLYAQTSLSDAIFLLRPSILAHLPLDPGAYRERSLWEVSPGVRFLSLNLIHLPSGLEVPLPEDVEAELLRFMQDPELQRFQRQPFADPQPLDNESTFTWPYLLEAALRQPDDPSSSRTLQLYLSERMGGTTQYAGHPESGLVGTLTPPVIEALDSLLARFPVATPGNLPAAPAADETDADAPPPSTSDPASP
jgi:hypothetical protein